MSEYYYDLRDLRFNLFDFLQLGSLGENPRFEGQDAELYDDVLNAAFEQARELLFPLNAQGDREGLGFENGQVRMPEGWREAYQTYMQSGWNGLCVPAEYGGQGLPRTIDAAVQEITGAANLSFIFTPGLTAGGVDLLIQHGTDEQRATFLDKMLSGEWSGTMALTEPHAGTAVPDLRTTAYPTGEDGHYRIKGQKVYTTSGDHDLADNIVHMVLARVDGDPAGSKGISLFIVPKYWPKEDGTLEPNDVTTVSIEEKLGIHASPTCQLSFGDEDACRGWMLGPRGEGLKCMFLLMNEARIGVGIQGTALANLAYQRAVRYAKERVQGTRIQDLRKADAERVSIIHHPDVRRMLLHMKAIGEASRAMVCYAASCHDRQDLAEDPKEARRWEHQLELLTPIVKAWCSDEGFRATETGIQVHGGYGYLSDSGMEQLLRDAKIASIYEGTNGVQALDLLARKVAKGGGAMFMTMINEINAFVDGPAKEGTFASEVDQLAKARDAVTKIAMGFGQRRMKGDISYSALHAVPFLQMFGDLVAGWLLLRQATVAQELFDSRLKHRDLEDKVEDDENLGQVLEEDEEARFLHGKVATAQFFVHQILPRVHARRASIDTEDRSALNVWL